MDRSVIVRVFDAFFLLIISIFLILDSQITFLNCRLHISVLTLKICYLNLAPFDLIKLKSRNLFRSLSEAD